MNVGAIREKLQKKPLLYVVIPTVYLFFLIIIRWRLSFPIDALFFFIGGLVGIFLLDIVEVLFSSFKITTPESNGKIQNEVPTGEAPTGASLSISPFHTMVFAIAIGICGIYVVTSATELFAKGLVLTMTMSLLFFLLDDWKTKHNFSSWYTFLFGEVREQIQFVGVAIFVLLFLIESVLFLF